MARSFPPDVLLLDSESLLHARFARGKTNPRLTQAKTYRLPADTFTASPVTPQLASESALAETLRRLKMETGSWQRVSLLLPDSWFRMNLVELPAFGERQRDALDVVRWSLKRTLPIPPEDLRIAFEVLSPRGENPVKLLVLSAVEKTLATIEKVFGEAGFELVLIEPAGLNLWNAVAVRESDARKDRLFLYLRDDEFTTAVFRGAQPLFLRSRNLTGDRTLLQEIRLSANYLRDTLRTETFETCYVAGSRASEDVAATLSSEFGSPVRTIALRDFVEQTPGEIPPKEAELTACTGVFTA